MLIKHRQVNDKGLFFAEIDGNILAELVYTMPSPGRMIIEHTEVSDELQEMKVGNSLVRTAVEFARLKSMKITALCPFANAAFERKPEYGDVLA
jgi:predicted GNAT family acetyltransferase